MILLLKCVVGGLWRQYNQCKANFGAHFFIPYAHYFDPLVFKMSASVLQGYQLYHNYFRPHESLDGKTPAEMCEIKIEGKNKWITLIQNASKNKC
jgi:hypothetical protein